jgi:hypothetical protein
MGVMMAKKFMARRIVFQFKRASLTRRQENFSRSMSEVVVAPWPSSSCDVCRDGFLFFGQELSRGLGCGERKKAAEMPKMTVMPPRRRK